MSVQNKIKKVDPQTAFKEKLRLNKIALQGNVHFFKLWPKNGAKPTYTDVTKLNAALYTNISSLRYMSCIERLQNVIKCMPSVDMAYGALYYFEKNGSVQKVAKILGLSDQRAYAQVQKICKWLRTPFIRYYILTGRYAVPARGKCLLSLTHLPTPLKNALKRAGFTTAEQVNAWIRESPYLVPNIPGVGSVYAVTLLEAEKRNWFGRVK